MVSARFLYFVELCRIQFVVVSFLCHQFVVRSAFHDTAVVDIHDLIAVADRGQTVGDDERCSALQHRVKTRLQCFFGLYVNA